MALQGKDDQAPRFDLTPGTHAKYQELRTICNAINVDVLAGANQSLVEPEMRNFDSEVQTTNDPERISHHCFRLRGVKQRYEHILGGVITPDINANRAEAVIRLAIGKGWVRPVDMDADIREVIIGFKQLAARFMRFTKIVQEKGNDATDEVLSLYLGGGQKPVEAWYTDKSRRIRNHEDDVSPLTPDVALDAALLPTRPDIAYDEARTLLIFFRTLAHSFAGNIM